MKAEALDPVDLFAQLDPLTADRLSDLADGAARETTFARIAARRDSSPARARSVPRRGLTIAAAAALALVIPALAFSGVFTSLFGFSNHGAPVEGSLSAVHGFDLSGAKPGSVVQLAARGKVGVYGAKTAAGGLCYFIGPANQGKLKSEGLGGGCMNARASARFPSTAQPVVDISLYALAPGEAGPSIEQLAGVAADGVASIQLLALSDCRVIAATPVTDNVYVANDLPTVPEAQIVARDASGNAVWHEAVTPPTNANATSCGLG